MIYKIILRKIEKFVIQKIILREIANIRNIEIKYVINLVNKEKIKKL